MTQEFDAQHDRWIDIADTLDRRGAVLIRRGLDRAVLAALLREANAEYARRDAQHEAGALPADQHDTHVLYRSIPIDQLAVEGVAAHLWLATPLAVAVASVVLRKSPQIGYASFRCARPTNENLKLPYHQDSRIVAMMAPDRGPSPPLVNMWVPLQDCGQQRPGLELVNRPTAALSPVSQTGGLYAEIGIEIAPEMVEPGDRWHPTFAAGDFLLFKGTMIHRTHVTPTMTLERISADIRLL